MKKIQKQLLQEHPNVMLSSRSELTDEQVRYFRDNPEELTLILDRETIQSRLLVRVMLAGVFMVAGSKLLAYNFSDQLSQFANDVLVDLVFELGAALLGGAATAFFIEIQQKRQFQENLLLKDEIEKRIATLDQSERS